MEPSQLVPGQLSASAFPFLGGNIIDAFSPAIVTLLWVSNMTIDQYLHGFHLNPQCFPYCFGRVSITGLAKVVSKLSLRRIAIGWTHFFWVSRILEWKSLPVSSVVSAIWCPPLWVVQDPVQLSGSACTGSWSGTGFSCPEVLPRKSSLPSLVSGSTLPVGQRPSRAITCWYKVVSPLQTWLLMACMQLHGQCATLKMSVSLVNMRLS